MIPRKENGGGRKKKKKECLLVYANWRVVCVCAKKRAKGQKESKSIVGFGLYSQWMVLVNICIVVFVQLRTPTLSLASASQAVIWGI